MRLAQPSPNWRNLIAGLETVIPLRDGSQVTAVNFDNAATTPPFVTVLQAINNFAGLYSSVHRGTGYKSQVCSEVLEQARCTVAEFIQADLREQTIVFVKNTTEAINKLSYRLYYRRNLPMVLSTEMEHHSNDLPWRKYALDYIATDYSGHLVLDDLETKLAKHRGLVKLVTVTGASNVTGYVNPIHTIAEISHRYNAKILVDGAQLVPHFPLDMKPVGSAQHIDYLAFSAHKMYAPFGTGVLVGPKKTFDNGSPEFSGGGTVRLVTRKSVVWDDPPHKEEAGTPNLMGILALDSAIKTLKVLSVGDIHRYEKSLAEYALAQLKNIPGMQLYITQKPGEECLGLIPFNLKGIPHGILAEILGEEAGISVRHGCFCAQPYVRKLMGYPAEGNGPLPGMVRLSFGCYNLYGEIDTLIQALLRIAANPNQYLKRYRAGRSAKHH